jgi:TRAP-type transport system large permease protein
MTIAVFLGALLVAMALGIPIAFSLLLSAAALMWHLNNFDAQILAQNLIEGANSFPLLAVPFFMLAGEVMNAGGLSKRIVNLALALVGHVRGGLGYVAIVAAVIMAALSGSAVADAAALSALLLPMMVAAGHDKARSAGLLSAASIIAPVIPPSIGFVIFGVAAGVSVSKLFLAGIVPGLMLALSLWVTWWFLVRKEQTTTPPRRKAGEVLAALKDSTFALGLPLIVIVGLKFGVFTPTEAAVVAAVYALLVSMFIYRELKWQQLYGLFLAAAKTTSVIMFLVAAAMVSAWLITVAQLPQQIVGLLQPFLDNPKLLMFAIMVLVMVVGTAMDMTPTILILTPVLMPVVKAAGIDPVYFGVLFIINNAIGLITPPVGTVLNTVAGGPGHARGVAFYAGAVCSDVSHGAFP